MQQNLSKPEQNLSKPDKKLSKPDRVYREFFATKLLLCQADGQEIILDFTTISMQLLKYFRFFSALQNCCTMVIQKFKCGWTVFAHICHFCHLNVCQWSWDKRASLGGDWAWDTIDVLQDNASAISYCEITFSTGIRDSDHYITHGSGIVTKATWSDFESKKHLIPRSSSRPPSPFPCNLGTTHIFPGGGD